MHYFIASVHVVPDNINSACVFILLLVRLYTFHAVCHGVRDQQRGFIAVLKTFNG